MRFLFRAHTSVGLSAALLLGELLTGCQSNPNSATATSQTESLPAAPELHDTPGTWYRCYSGTLGSDSITLHLQTWPASPESRSNASFVGSYSGADGHPYELASDYDAIANLDSIVVRDRDLKFADATSSGPVWRLQLNGKNLTGSRAGQHVQLREVQLPGSTSFVSRYFSDSVAAYPGKAKSIYGRTSLHVLVPASGPEATRSALAAGILRSLRNDTLDTPASPRQYWQEQLTAFRKEYQTSVADLVKSQPDAPDTSSDAPAYDYMLRYEDQVATHVLWNQGNLLSLGLFTYSYTGGAHGNYGTRAVTFDARTGRTLRFPDIFRPNTTAQLSALLEQAVRRTLRQPANVKLDEFLFVKTMPVTHNVYLTSGGAVFIYTPYEIAAYAQGEIRLFVPVQQLRPLLNPGLPWGGGEVSKR